jgi:hypothetical protein
MVKAAAILAHINPLTNSHVDIISHFQENYNIYIFPVRFLKDGKEINTKSFPFPYELRKAMLESVFPKVPNLTISPDYTFFSPFIKYLPPLISPYSWMLRSKILQNIHESEFVTYTGDISEKRILQAYRLHPIKANRLEISASAVKDMLYTQANNKRSYYYSSHNKTQAWQERVPEKVAGLINDNWKIIDRFARSPDLTVRVFGMKFPKEGFR